MEQIKTTSLKNIRIESIKFIILLGLAILAPLLQNQFITGTIVNAILFISVFVSGISGAIAIAFFPSLISLGLGFLPGAMAPMVPFIITGNIILISVFFWLKNKNYWFAAATGSILKFVFLALTSQTIISLFVQKPIAEKIAIMMSWPQLITALSGSFLAYAFFKKFLKNN